jgi:hypothetical protein
MNPLARRKLGLFLSLGLIFALILLFPRALVWLELAARELRYMWWLIAILAVGVWMIIYFRKKHD